MPARSAAVVVTTLLIVIANLLSPGPAHASPAAQYSNRSR